MLRQRDVALAIDQRMEHVRQKSYRWRKVWIGIWDKHTEFEDARAIEPFVDKDNPVEDYQKLMLEYKKKTKCWPYRSNYLTKALHRHQEDNVLDYED